MPSYKFSLKFGLRKFGRSVCELGIENMSGQHSYADMASIFIDDDKTSVEEETERVGVVARSYQSENCLHV